MSRGKNPKFQLLHGLSNGPNIKWIFLVYTRKLDYLEAAINRGNQISGDCNVFVIVKLESRNDVDVKDWVD